MPLVAEVVHQDDLVQRLLRGLVQHAPDGPQQRRPGLVGEDDHHGGGRQGGRAVVAKGGRGR